MKSPLRIRVEVEREDHEQALIALERAGIREREARRKLEVALDDLEKGEKK